MAAGQTRAGLLRFVTAWWLFERAARGAELKPIAKAKAAPRIFEEQFEVVADTAAPLSRQKENVAKLSAPAPPAESSAVAAGPADPSSDAPPHLPPDESARPEPTGAPQPPELSVAAAGQPPVVQPKDRQRLDSARVQNPHEPEATYSVKGKGEKKKEHVGYKVQVAETVKAEALVEVGQPAVVRAFVRHRGRFSFGKFRDPASGNTTHCWRRRCAPPR